MHKRFSWFHHPTSIERQHSLTKGFTGSWICMSWNCKKPFSSTRRAVSSGVLTSISWVKHRRREGDRPSVSSEAATTRTSPSRTCICSTANVQDWQVIRKPACYIIFITPDGNPLHTTYQDMYVQFLNTQSYYCEVPYVLTYVSFWEKEP